MEKRAVLAAILMAGLLIVYQMFFFPTTQSPTEAPGTPPPATAPAPSKAAAPAPPAPAAANVMPVPAAPAGPRPPQRTVDVDGPLYHGVVSSEGGKLQEWTLKYRGPKPMVIVGELGPTGLTIAPDPAQPGHVVPMSIADDGVELGPERPNGAVVLAGEADGLRVRQTMRFDAERFAIDVDLRLENPGGAPRTVAVALPWAAQPPVKGQADKFAGQHPTEVVWSANGHINRIDDRTKVGSHVIEGEWIGLDSTWYLSALVPRSPGFTLVASGEPPAHVKDPQPGHVTIAVRATPTIAPGQAWDGHVTMYVGPKEYHRLAAYGLQGTLNFGGFPIPRKYGGLPMEWLGVPILRLMNWVYGYVGNYGVAIILLTVVSKLIFYPLTVKSVRSMRAMQALQPQINSLRSKYKSDPQRLQRETLELYRKHRVNPMGGCLPMVAQVPIFYALYLALSVSVELQNAPLLCFGHAFGMDLWVCDLASHDPTYILPIIMGITMFVQQKMSPTMGDPRQAKAMLIMPFVFTFMFLNLPAGLVLYWTMSNVLQILQQWYMDRPSARRAAREAKDAVRA
jgi:YidC/Oxa1 family membrane protein insertase